MQTTLNPVDLAQAQALLRRLPDTFSSILRTVHLKATPDGHICVSYDTQGSSKREVTATSPDEAIRLVLVDLASYVASSAQQHESIQMSSTLAGVELLTETSSSERTLFKAKQQTLGASLPSRLKEHLSELAATESTSFADVCRRFVVFGFEDFVARSLYASPTSLFDVLSNELHEWDDSNTEQVMVRLDPGHAMRLRSTAKEYEKSVSELTVLCAAHGIAMQRLLEPLKSRISKCRGPAVRSLVSKLGLQPFAVPLVSGILAGSVRAPRKLLPKLALALEAPESLLPTVFRGSFDRRLVPAFKAEAGKPELSMAPTTWTTAVKALSLSPEDAKALLELGV
ncbi:MULTISPECIES: hypothetical protein [Variovorax]|jgi:hypothetical protein|uniref:hypothetical protein n=1 Tax=Variovorax TaxID=34072 RepID=UPI00285D4D40|nr:hypothetical protein [Variovorax sp. 3319]MDR6886456.1 hypothetical protein [Variovorax sp. 3319]